MVCWFAGLLCLLCLQCLLCCSISPKDCWRIMPGALWGTLSTIVVFVVFVLVCRGLLWFAVVCWFAVFVVFAVFAVL